MSFVYTLSKLLKISDKSFFKNGNDEGASKENKSSAVSTNGNTLKSAF